MNEILKNKMEQKRAAILKAALKIFSAKGYNNTTIDEIADKAGLGKGTVYRYFKSKKDLFFALIEANVEEVRNEILQATSDKKDVIEHIKTGAEIYLRYFEKNQSFYQILIHEKSEFNSEAIIKHKRKKLEYVHLFEQLIQRGIDEGKIKPLDPKNLTIALMGMADGLIGRWLCGPKNRPLTDALPLILEIITSGIVNKT